MARPTKFDFDKWEQIIARMAVGDSREEAARAAGVCLRTLQGWLARGRAERESGRYGPLGDFARVFDRVAEFQRRIRVDLASERENARSAERWQRFKAARERWWFERLGPLQFWHQRLNWAIANDRPRAEAEARAELLKLIGGAGQAGESQGGGGRVIALTGHSKKGRHRTNRPPTEVRYRASGMWPGATSW